MSHQQQQMRATARRLLARSRWSLRSADVSQLSALANAGGKRACFVCLVALTWLVSGLAGDPPRAAAQTTINADFDGDGDVDRFDRREWRLNFDGTPEERRAWLDAWRSQRGQSVPTVPEPSTCLLMVMAIMQICLSRRRAVR